MQRVLQIESITFQNYKFKDVNRLLETMLRESHRLQVNQAMPQLLAEYNSYSFQVGLNLLHRQQTSKLKRRVRQAFDKMRGDLDRVVAFVNAIAKIDKSKQETKVLKAFYTWKSRRVVQPLTHYLL